MRRVRSIALSAVACALAVGCGASETLESREGEPVKLDGLSYNVRLTRFLNRNDAEDRSYLIGKRPAPSGKDYLGVFLRVENKGKVPATPRMYIEDTRGNEYRPIPTHSLYALDLDRQLAPDQIVPTPDTTAATGDAGGSLVLFLVPESASANRPLELRIPGSSGSTGMVELDL